MRLLSSFCFSFIFALSFASAAEVPHLTPQKLVGTRFPKDTFGGITVALVGYCPHPAILSNYEPEGTTEQYFIHIPPSSVQICRHGEHQFLSIAQVYGGPVSSALIEELGYYGIKYVLAYGFAGGLGTKGLKIGDFYLIETALVKDGTTPHYTDEPVSASDADLNETIFKLAKLNPELSEMVSVQTVTVDAIYREYDEEFKEAIDNHCDVINCDSSHLFAVSKAVGIVTTECGVISDVVDGENALSAMLSNSEDSAMNPLDQVGLLVEFYVEKLLPALAR